MRRNSIDQADQGTPAKTCEAADQRESELRRECETDTGARQRANEGHRVCEVLPSLCASLLSSALEARGVDGLLDRTFRTFLLELLVGALLQRIRVRSTVHGAIHRGASGRPKVFSR
jgi:hypothetical protein